MVFVQKQEESESRCILAALKNAQDKKFTTSSALVCVSFLLHNGLTLLQTQKLIHLSRCEVRQLNCIAIADVRVITHV